MPSGRSSAIWPARRLPTGSRCCAVLPRRRPTRENLKALCAAFGTTSAAPMLHVDGVTPEAHRVAADAEHARISRADMAAGWRLLNDGPRSGGTGRHRQPACFTRGMSEPGRCPWRQASGRGHHRHGGPRRDTGGPGGWNARRGSKLRACRVLPDLCWCSISEPVFPPGTRTLMTNSGKYAHYGPGLSGRAVRFGGLSDCAEAAVSGRASQSLPHWLE